MKIGMYCFRDRKADYWFPFKSINDQIAQREFLNAVNYSQNDFMKCNYADLDLYKVGVFDDQTGFIESDVVYLCNGVDVRKGDE